VDVEQRFALAREQHRAGALPEAERGYRAALRIAPDHAPTLQALGILLFATDRRDEAFASMREAISRAPEETVYLVNLGGLLTQAGQLNAAIDMCRKATQLAPRDPRGFFNLGVAEQAAGGLLNACAAFETVVELAPHDVEGYVNLGAVLSALHELEAAQLALTRAVEIQPHNADAQNNLGGVLQRLGRTQEAIEAYERALSARPDDARTLGNLASALAELGQLEAAEAAYRTALSTRPHDARLHRHLALLRPHQVGDADTAAMEALWADTELKTSDRVQLAFGLGKALDDAGQHEEAFNKFSEGNRLHRATLTHDAAASHAYLVDIAAVCSTRLEPLPVSSTPHPAPIFVLGMPRSGTTLVETILSSHSQVDAGGELTFLGDLVRACGERRKASYPSVVNRLTAEDRDWMATEYVRRSAQLGFEARWHTDKMPSNFLYLGLIRTLFPYAKIVHCKRNAIDTCLSCYVTYFSAPQPFAYDITELAAYYSGYTALMAHWRDLYGPALVEVEYERLVDDPEGQTRTLLEACGLPFEAACLSPHRSGGVVRTASLAQVRQPIYTSSVERWRRYGSAVEPLLQALDGVSH